jgi:N-acetylgalactosamine-N,N'-diacetylbacillosaminyl-diphospho-undecaprenol 4-alpha-N-acetylgalactosaminyltransferase
MIPDDALKKKICFVVNAVSGGGAEKQLRYLLEKLEKGSYSVALVLLNDKNCNADFYMNEVEVLRLNMSANPLSIIRGILSFRSYLRSFKPECLVSFMWRANIFSLIFSSGLVKRRIISERAHTDYIFREYSFIWPFLMKLTYRKADLIVAVAGDVRDSLIANFRLDPAKIEVIYNGVDPQQLAAFAEGLPDTEKPYLLAVGRLAYQKGYDMMLESVRNIGIKLVVLGEGSLETFIRRKASDYRVEVELAGFRDNPYVYMRNAEMLLLTSRYEGLSNTVLEAMALGCPIAAMSCPGGMAELLQDGYNCLLCEQGDTEAMGRNIRRLTDEPDLRKRIADNARSYVEAFRLKDKLSEFEENILSITAARPEKT